MKTAQFSLFFRREVAMGQKTPLYETHVQQGAKIVDFGGWDMPLHYGSQIEEHHAVRRDAGMFDVSHMAVVDVTGTRAFDFLRYLLANDIARLKHFGKALYSCMLLPNGGVIDDLIVYYMSESWYRLVVNAGTRDKDIAWIRQHAVEYGTEVVERDDIGIIAVQGPGAREKAVQLLASTQRKPALALGAFFGAPFGSWFVARTGYTGEDGFELMIPAADIVDAWDRLRNLGVKPAGLGARDTLRLEAGMNLYGNDMDEARHPLESGLAWTVAFEPADRVFIGRAALERARREGGAQLIGLLLEDRGVLRSHQKVMSGAHLTAEAGEVTSGTFSPTLNRSIALARVPQGSYETVQVEIRGKLHAARVVKPPFVRHGKSLIDL
jgi:aminomethyltransferase